MVDGGRREDKKSTEKERERETARCGAASSSGRADASGTDGSTWRERISCLVKFHGTMDGTRVAVCNLQPSFNQYSRYGAPKDSRLWRGLDGERRIAGFHERVTSIAQNLPGGMRHLECSSFLVTFFLLPLPSPLLQRDAIRRMPRDPRRSRETESRNCSRAANATRKIKGRNIASSETRRH